ncbi:hypothetical protein CIB48_g10738 [Xylaria polymorpha]|nr:hypothetical protein CIB48_g10738 [Xylaria polymorpha]
MLLASSEESLELLREEQAVRSSDEEEEFTDEEYFAASGKRKTTASRRHGTKHFKRRLGGDHPQNASRFYLQWAGCETGTAYLVLDEDHERTGYFDLDKSGMTARGQFRCRRLFGDKHLVFTLLKVADTPRKIQTHGRAIARKIVGFVGNCVNLDTTWSASGDPLDPNIRIVDSGLGVGIVF